MVVRVIALFLFAMVLLMVRMVSEATLWNPETLSCSREKLAPLTSVLTGGTRTLPISDDMTPLKVLLTTMLMVTLTMPFPRVNLPNLPKNVTNSRPNQLTE